MLSPEPMRHLSLVVPAADLEPSTRTIADIGVLHLLDVRHLSEALAAIRPYDMSQRLAQLDALTRTLGSVRRVLGSDSDDTASMDGGEDGLDLNAAEARAGAIAAEVESLRRRRLQVVDDTEHLESLRRNLKAFAPLDIPLEKLRSLHYLHLTSGLLPERNATRLRDSLRRVVCLLVPVGHTQPDGRLLITGVCLRADQEVFERALRSAQFEPVEVPAHLTGAPEQAIAEVEAQLTASRRSLADLDQERAALAKRLTPEIGALAARVQRERLLGEARGLMGHSERVALISGWVPAVVAPRVERAIRAVASRCVVHWQDPSALEDVRRGHIPVPILLHNPVLIRPFERLLRGYGLPRYGEIEPTPVIAIAFLTMFGFMFGDVGQGAVLFAAGYFIYRRMFRYRDYAVILMECGVAAVLFGFLYGSVFGVEHWLPALWLRPMDDIGTLVRTALVFGALFLSVGLILNLVNALRRRDAAALWERNGLLAALAYWIAVGLFIRRLTAGAEAVPVGAVLLWLGPPLTLIFLKQPALAIWKAVHTRQSLGAADLFAVFVESLVEVLDTLVSTISNTATFIRLAAFALSHAGLFLATFSVADAVSRSGGGSVAAVLVIALGNVMIIGLEGLIVSIQSIRLEYYEFFSKFYSGGGEAYRPLRLRPASSAVP